MRRNLRCPHYSTIVGFMCLTLLFIPTEPGADSSINLVHSSQATSKSSTGKNSSSGSQPKHDDDTLAALTIYFEAQGESFAGKLAVAAVIRNRMVHRFHSDGTVRGTVLRPKQFEPWITRDPDIVPFDPVNTKMKESLLAWKLVQDGREIVDGAVLFYNPRIVKTPRWALVHRKVARIGGHEFFHTQKI